MMRIWLIDDEISLLGAKDLLKVEDGQITVSEPDGEAFEQALEEVLDESFDLILVDEELWQGRKPPHAVDGGSLVASLRAWARMNKVNLPGVVIFTNKPRAFENEVPAVGAWRPVASSFVDHEALIGRTLDVEWLLTKQDPQLAAKVADLASSYGRARDCFGAGGISFEELIGYLAIPDEPWEEAARAAIREARPPVTEENAAAPHPQRGPATVMVWLLQRVLAFPGLFVSDNYAAITLGISPAALKKVTASPPPGLSEAIYTGPLHTLVGRRWWSPGLDYLVIGAEQEGISTWEKLGLSGSDRLTVEDPVVVLDSSLVESGIAPILEAVRVHPQGWPAEALQPWMKRSETTNPKWLSEMVDPADRTDEQA